MTKIVFLLSIIFSMTIRADLKEDRAKERIVEYFIQTGLDLIDDLQAHGTSWSMNEITINCKLLKKTVSKNKISVSVEELKDNRDSLVDAIGEKDSIILYMESWQNNIRQGKDMRRLVLHEMLRSAGYNDDNYVFSTHFYKRMSSIVNNDESVASLPYCNLNVSKYSKKIKKSFWSYSAEGTFHNAATTSSNRIIINTMSPSFKTNAQNAYKLASDGLIGKCRKKGFTGAQIASSWITMGSSTQSTGLMGKTEKFTKVTVKGKCIKNKLKNISSSQYRSLYCKKLKTCLDTYNAAPEGQLTSSDFTWLFNDLETNQCD